MTLTQPMVHWNLKFCLFNERNLKSWVYKRIRQTWAHSRFDQFTDRIRYAIIFYTAFFYYIISFSFSKFILLESVYEYFNRLTKRWIIFQKKRRVVFYSRCEIRERIFLWKLSSRKLEKSVDRPSRVTLALVYRGQLSRNPPPIIVHYRRCRN